MDNLIDFSNQILQQLPKYNCSRCGYNSCELFLEKLLTVDEKELFNNLELCPFIGKGRFKDSNKNIIKIFNQIEKSNLQLKTQVYGIIDNLKADFVLSPFDNDCSCKEEIYPLDKKIILKIDDYISYRPLGCPITHFAKILLIKNSILTISIIGPQNRIYTLKKDIIQKDIGLCLIISFEGILLYGRKPLVGQTVTFIPKGCMMQKVHKGIIVHSEGKKLRIESIDLKI